MTKVVPLPEGILVDTNFRTTLQQVVNIADPSNAVAAAYLVPAVIAFNPHGSLELTIPHFRNGNIRTYLKDKPVDEQRRMLLKCSKALDAVHGAFGAHGNIKPENFLVTDDLDIRILFEFTRPCKSHEELPREEDSPPVHTINGDRAGFGSVIYEILTGTPPFYPHNYGRRMFKNLEELKLMERRNLTDDIWGLLTDCWSPGNPSARPSAGEVTARLTALPASRMVNN
ncbi:hypothetical protein JAAARDRAFT_206837 [Jaapia argillacea MUCL 33604]|uniref:Protein kinase domain-containing protein n=1 Tax=Jaapia argillacea MUCL 33604 TaxID=933084 RepID=A0A067PTS7_9AGAM|nr:hypothetical protein JAAARDRAFT_206837 [Jaapia argillacea MUCL 33604]